MRCSLLTLSCYLDGELEALEHGELEAHLVGCPRCRAGLSHLRDEVELIGGLAQVRVPEASARAMLEVLGLIRPDDVLPERTPHPSEQSAPEPPSRGTQRGGALPWAVPARVARTVSPSDAWGPESPAPAERASPIGAMPTAPPGAGLTALEAGGPAGVEELAAGATPAGGGAVTATAPAAAPGRTADEDAAREEADLAMVVAPDPAAGVAGSVPSAGSSATSVRTTPAPVGDIATGMTRPDAAATFASAGAATTLASAAAATVASAGPTAPPQSDADRSRSAATPDPSVPPPPLPPTSVVPPLPGGLPVAVSLHDTPPATANTVGEGFDRPDADPHSPRAPGDEGPRPAPRPSLFERFREKLAMRRALTGNVGPGFDDSVEVISGLGAPLRRGSVRADLAHRRSEALRPTALAEPPSPPRSTGAWEHLPPIVQPTSVAEIGAASVSGTPVDPFGARPRDGQAAASTRGPLAAPPPPSALAAQRSAAVGLPRAAANGAVVAPLPHTPLPHSPLPHTPLPYAPLRHERPGAATFAPPAPPGASPSELREGRRLLLLYVGAMVVVFLVALSSARVIWPLAPSSPASSSTQRAQAIAPLASPPAASASHAAQPTASSQAPAALPLAVPRSAGAGGTGWQIRDVRYGAHGSYFVVVFDLVGGSAAPKVTVVSQDAQTLLVTVAGTTGATLLAEPSSGQWVSGVGLVSPSPTPGTAVYRIILSKPGHGTPGIVPATATAAMRVAITITA